jgi:hypothetical protein
MSREAREAREERIVRERIGGLNVWLRKLLEEENPHTLRTLFLSMGSLAAFLGLRSYEDGKRREAQIRGAVGITPTPLEARLQDAELQQRLAQALPPTG